MHAFLVVGENVDTLINKLNAKPLEFPIQKIEHTRDLAKSLRLHYPEKTAIICRNIEQATEEAINAFLKNLEEPQKNIYFVLTTQSLSKVLPTIVSRCQVVWDKPLEINEKLTEKAQKFIEKSPGEMFNAIDKIKERSEALDLVTGIIEYLRIQMEKGETNYKNSAKVAEEAIKTWNKIKGNGYINLQLSNLAIILSANPLKSSKN